MKPLDAPPLDAELIEDEDGTFQVKWYCPTCTLSGMTEERGSAFLAYYASMHIEANHGEGRCNR